VRIASKSSKTVFAADRLSCYHFRANAFRAKCCFTLHAILSLAEGSSRALSIYQSLLRGRPSRKANGIRSLAEMRDRIARIRTITHWFDPEPISRLHFACTAILFQRGKLDSDSPDGTVGTRVPRRRASASQRPSGGPANPASPARNIAMQSKRLVVPPKPNVSSIVVANFEGACLVGARPSLRRESSSAG
jgi:hypothetical protein